MVSRRVGHSGRSVLGGAVVAVALVAADADAIEPFTEEAAARGLVYQMQPWPQVYGYLGFGCGFADLDEDGDPDVVVLGAADGHVGIFENLGAGTFVDRSFLTGIPPLPQGSAFTAGDYDNDGDLDLYLTQLGLPNVLVRNDGGFTFTNVSSDIPVDAGASNAACFGDFDGDGWLDLYLCNYNGIVEGTDFIDNKLFRNLGNGTFEEVGVAHGVNDSGSGFQAVWFDYDLDGDVDLYLSNDRGHLNQKPNQLWRNDGGQLVNVSEGSGANLGLFSMGVACGDFDRNGYPDLYCTNIPGGGGVDNPLFLNQGDGTFVESSVEAGVNNPWVSWGSIFFDLDNDGRQELYVNNMWDHNTLFKDVDGFPCVELAVAAGVEGPLGDGNLGPASFSSAVADVDGDGDLDLLVNDVGDVVRLYMNHDGDARNWVKYRLVGGVLNRFAVGGRIETHAGSVLNLREVLAGGNGYLGQNELTLHVGLDQATVVDEAIVSWPGGSPARTLTGLPANAEWTIYPPARLGDAAGDGAAGDDDLAILLDCYGQTITPGCEVMDFDGDSMIDSADAAAFGAVYSGTAADCDGDSVPDTLQLLIDPGDDANANAVIDLCEQQGDVNGDGQVDVADLTMVVLNWGVCGTPCLGDVNGDGVVSIPDLVAVILAWSG